MSFLDRLFGRRPEPVSSRRTSQGTDDTRAVERYRYLLRTAPPDQLEQAHLEAFERLTPEQRAIVRDDLAAAAPGDAPASTEPADLARSATRAELREPGTLERTFERRGAMPGMAGSFMNTFAAVFIGTTVAQAMFGGWGGESGGDAGADGDAGGDAGPEDGGWEAGGDFGGGDFGGGDLGGFGDF